MPSAEAVGFPFRSSGGEPPEEYRRLREHSPVSPVVLPSGDTAWLVTRHRDIRTVASDPRFSRDIATIRIGTGRDYFVSSGSFMNADPPGHTRLRRLVRPFFTATALRAFEPTVHRAARECFDRFTRLGPPADLVGQLAYPFTVRVTCALLGVEDETDVDLARSWAEVIPSLTRASAADIDRATEEMGDYLTQLLDRKTTRPGADLLSAVAAARAAGEVTDREAVNLARLMFFAGQDSPTNLMTRGTLLFLRHPDQWTTLRRDPDLVDAAVEEILRYAMVSGTGLTHVAVAVEDVELSGTVIPAGAAVIFPYIAANRDPAAFHRPDTFDITRTDTGDHLAFGHGIHYCLGAPLGRIQLRVWFRTLATRFPDLRLAADESELSWSTDLLPNRVKELAVAW
jgi:cytochrome P450